MYIHTKLIKLGARQSKKRFVDQTLSSNEVHQKLHYFNNFLMFLKVLFIFST